MYLEILDGFFPLGYHMDKTKKGAEYFENLKLFT